MRVLPFVLSFVCAVAMFVVILISSVQWVAFSDVEYYQREFEKHDSYSFVDAPKESVDKAAWLLVEYMLDETDSLDMPAGEGYEGEYFTEREKSHMVDVKELVQGGIVIRRAAVAVFALCVAGLLILKSDFKTVCSAFAVVSGFIIAVSAFFAIAMVIDFNGLFILFHETFFNNDLWLLDPAESRLINMVPLEFFIDTVVNILVRFETCVAAVLILSTAYLIIRLRKRLKG